MITGCSFVLLWDESNLCESPAMGRDYSLTVKGAV